jgi:hypothetical protein
MSYAVFLQSGFTLCIGARFYHRGKQEIEITPTFTALQTVAALKRTATEKSARRTYKILSAAALQFWEEEQTRAAAERIC